MFVTKQVLFAGHVTQVLHLCLAERIFLDFPRSSITIRPAQRAACNLCCLCNANSSGSQAAQESAAWPRLQRRMEASIWHLRPQQQQRQQQSSHWHSSPAWKTHVAVPHVAYKCCPATYGCCCCCWCLWCCIQANRITAACSSSTSSAASASASATSYENSANTSPSSSSSSANFPWWCQVQYLINHLCRRFVCILFTDTSPGGASNWSH